MADDALENLVNINKLKKEPPDAKEFYGMLNAAKTKLVDASIDGLSMDSQFSLAYSAAHALSLAALRYRGYRCDQRYLVFQCLQHTLDFPKAKWRVLDKCHRVRNLAEYEGHLEIDEQLLKELKAIADELYQVVSALPKLE